MNTPKHLFLMFLALLAFSVGPLYSEAQLGGNFPEAPSTSKMSVNVSGAVTRPGTLQLPNGATVLDALAAAGGPTEWANTKRALVFRKTGEKIIINLHEMSAGKTTPTPLTEGDRLFLPTVGSRFRSLVDHAQ